MARDPKLVPLGRILRSEDTGLVHQGKDYLTAAITQAEKIIANARNEATLMTIEGRKRGEVEASEAITRHLAKSTRIVDELLARSESWLAELAVDIVQRILDDRDPRETLIRAAVAAIRDFRHARSLTVRANPAEVDFIERELDQRLEAGLRALVVVRPDSDLAEDRCVVACEYGTVEAGIAAQLNALRAGLAETGGDRTDDAA